MYINLVQCFIILISLAGIIRCISYCCVPIANMSARTLPESVKP